MLNNQTILITGGTGSFGKKCIEMIFESFQPKKIIIFSRDEFKQSQVKLLFQKKLKESQMARLSFFLGDVRDQNRLYRAFNGVDYVIHAAAMKQVPACEC